MPELQERLWPYMGGIARDNRMKALAIGGMEDHVHRTLAIAKAVQLVKGGSSRWVHDTLPQHRSFAWQEGYGAFSIGISQVDITVAYIKCGIIGARRFKKSSWRSWRSMASSTIHATSL